MLNELMLVRNGLASINPSSLKPIHKSLSEPGNANLLRVILSEENDGCIAELECLSDNKNKLYWTQGKGNSNQFPAVKLLFPLRPGGVEPYCEWKKENRRPQDQNHLNAINEIRNSHPVDISKYCKKDSKENEGKPAGEGVSEEQGKPADSGKAEIEWPNYRDKLKERAIIYQELKDDANIVSRLICRRSLHGGRGLKRECLNNHATGRDRRLVICLHRRGMDRVVFACRGEKVSHFHRRVL